MNKIILSGGITRDAELTFIGSTGTPKMSFSLAVERGYQKDKNNKVVDYINCEMIGKHTENLCQYITKGKQIFVEGELNIDSYMKDDERKTYTKVKVDKLEFQKGGAAANADMKVKNEFKLEEFGNFETEEVPF